MSFSDILNISIPASWLVLAVMLARLLLKKAPKALHCCLWALVAIRLLCPISLESRLSLQPTREVIPGGYMQLEPKDTAFTEPATLEIVTNPIYDTPVRVQIAPTVDRLQTWDLISSVVWLTGVGAMALFAAYSYLSVRLRLRMAAWVGGNVWECDDLASPFILGIFRPRIYLPSELDEQTRAHVLAHERAHLSRLDHIWKPLGFALLSIHWFNPLMWAAYALLCRDIELACDEKVVKKLDRQAVAAYSGALIRCAVSRRTIALCPLAFGEVAVKNRIKSILHYKKPGFWVLLLAVVLSVILAVCFLTDPADPDRPDEQGIYTPEALLGQELYLSEVVFSDQDHGLPYTLENAPVYTLSRTSDGRIQLTSVSTGAFGEKHDTLGCLVPSELSADDFSPHVHGEHMLHELLSGENAIFWQLEKETALTNLHHMLILPEEGGIYLASLEQQTNDLRDLYRLTPGESEPPLRAPADAYLLDRSAYAPYFQLSGGRFTLTQFPDENTKITGSYDFTDPTLTLRAESGQVWRFLMDDFDRMVFDAKNSDELLIRTDYGEVYLMDGATFDPAYDGSWEHSVSISGLAPGEKTYSDPFDITRENETILILASYVSLFPELTVGVEDCSGQIMAEGVTSGHEKISFTGFQPGEYRIFVINNSLDRSIDWGAVRYSPSGQGSSILGSEIQDQEDHRIYESALERAITQVILEQNATGQASERICTAAYQVMDQQELCMDGDPGSMVTTTYLLFRYHEYSSANNALLLELDICTPAVIELTESGSAYTLTEYWTPGTGDDHETELAQRLTAEALDYLKYVGDSTRESLDLTCRNAAQRRMEAGDLPEPEAQPQIRSYSLSADPALGPSFRLSTDGTFSFSPNPLSSYLGMGVYTISEYELVLRTDDGLNTWVFLPDGKDFLFSAEGSTPISYYPDLKNLIQLPDGARFTEVSPQTEFSASLDEAIGQAILGHYAPASQESTRRQAHEILDSQTVCGVAPAGGDGKNKELLVIYALTCYVEELDGAVLAEQTIPAVLTYEVTPEGYLLLSYETPRSGDPYQSDLEKFLTKAALTRLKEEEQELTVRLKEACASR